MIVDLLKDYLMHQTLDLLRNLPLIYFAAFVLIVFCLFYLRNGRKDLHGDQEIDGKDIVRETFLNREISETTANWGLISLAIIMIVVALWNAVFIL